MTRARRSPGLLLLAAFALLGCQADPEPEQARAPSPDLVLIVVDTLRADRLSAYGYERPTSPSLDRLAAEGALFEDVTSQSSWTLPSMASMLTGRRVFVNAKRMPADVPAVAEHLQAAGYETVALLGNPALSTPGTGYGRGFDHVLDRDTTGHGNWDAKDLGAALDQWLLEHPPGDAPRFYYLHFLDPHWPYEPERTESLPGDVRVQDHVLESWVDEARTNDVVRESFDKERRAIIDWLDAYDHEILNVDREIDRLLGRLARPERGRLMVLASDHGEGLWDHKHHTLLVERDQPPEQRTLSNVFFRDHSYHMFQELIFTPLIVHGPGFEGGHRIQRAVENVDIAPTLLRAAGLDIPADLDGQALQDVVAGTAPDKPYVFSHSQEATVVRRTRDDLKLIFGTPTGDFYGLPLMLFQLGSDPHEVKNLASRTETGTDVEDGYLSELRTLIATRERMAREFDLYLEGDAEQANSDQLEVLRSLGYIDLADNPIPTDQGEPGPETSNDPSADSH